MKRREDRLEQTEYGVSRSLKKYKNRLENLSRNKPYMSSRSFKNNFDVWNQ